MNKGFFDALRMLGDENSVSVDVLVEKIKSALMKAVKKSYPDCENININIDPEANVFEISIIKLVVDDEPLDDNEINIDVAKTIDPGAYVGGMIAVQIDTAQFGRAAAQSAKQSIKTDLREINRENLLSQFQSKENECISAKIIQIEPSRETATLLYDKTELYLFKKDQIPGEVLKEGQTVKVYITGIAGREKKPVIKISRTHKDLVKRLFELEVPEIYDGTVEIKSISREAGSRTKIAVFSKNPDVDAIGACIGPKRSRITNIVEELNGEKIDIVIYSENPEEFIAKSLAPSEVTKVILDEEERSCTVIVPDSQLSLAIGNRGQNAKLAAKLTGYKIDIKPESEAAKAEQESEEQSTDAEEAPVITEAPEDIIDSSEEQDTDIELPEE
ncbi:MAG: transcription termination/antitermination protein NusA [Ruminococcus sp.]|nr:transcription termination/antitermination protein NusA [Ruminococcus sp.]